MVVQCMRTGPVAVQQSLRDSFLPSLPLPLPLPNYPLSPCTSLLLTAEMEVKGKKRMRDGQLLEREREREGGGGLERF